MSSQYVIDLPALGASPDTIAACLTERLDSPYVVEVEEVLSVRLVASALFEVRGAGDVELNAQLLARAAIDYGFRVLHVVVLDVLAREWLPLIESLDVRLPSVVALQTSIVRGVGADLSDIVLDQARLEGFRDHLVSGI